MNPHTITMDFNDLTKEPVTTVATGVAALVGGFLGLAKALTFFKREKADSAEADADRVKSEADIAAYRRLIELLDISNGTVASLNRKIDEMKAEHAAQLEALTEKIASMERAHETQTRRLMREIVSLGGRIPNSFQDSRPGSLS